MDPFTSVTVRSAHPAARYEPGRNNVTRESHASRVTDRTTRHQEVPTPDTAARDLAGKLLSFLETGAPPDGLFAPDVFCDFTLPQWRLQAQGVRHVLALRRVGGPGPPPV